MRRDAVLVLALFSACAGQRPVAGEGARDVAGASELRSGPHDTAELAGEWMQYWSRAGEVDTERYVFTADGRFSWSAAARAAAERTATRKAGSYQLQRAGSVVDLVLRVQREQFEPCSGACAESQRGPHTVDHERPLTERYELGECAQNREAQLLDERYACVSVGGHAFWRKSLLSAAELNARLWSVR